ncbi:twin-arginine translocase subunit TatC [Sporolactobacillus sp. Y61]|uniref:Sec-independent protein translocase protein TatC n=1 Tax=Sporolactobacillus sp. Y61 TaxID=3160863 RepID=A0AAU8IIK5_9BACL
MTGKNMSLLNHLNELRRRLIAVFVAFILSAAVMLFFTKRLYLWLIRDLHVDGQLAVLSPADIVTVYFMIAGVAAIAVTIPFAAWQLWLFVAPALTRKERRIALSYIPALFLLFLGGIAFGYFIVFPNIFHFLMSMNDGMFQLVFTAERYFRFMMQVVLPFGLIFELPVIVVFLTNLGILNPVRMRKMRKISYFVLIILGVALSPPDFVSDTVMSVPLLLLYEICVTLSAITWRRKLKRRAQSEGELSAAAEQTHEHNL